MFIALRWSAVGLFSSLFCRQHSNFSAICRSEITKNNPGLSLTLCLGLHGHGILKGTGNNHITYFNGKDLDTPSAYPAPNQSLEFSSVASLPVSISERYVLPFVPECGLGSQRNRSLVILDFKCGFFDINHLPEQYCIDIDRNRILGQGLFSIKRCCGLPGRSDPVHNARKERKR